MSLADQTKRIHPLVAVAAVTVTMFSLVGIAAITGVLPTSRGESTEAYVQPSEMPRDPQTRQPVAHAAAKKAQSAEVNRSSEQTPVAQAPAPQAPVAQPKPVAQNSPVGIGVGAVIGGVIGNQMGSGDGKTLATIAGAIGGGYLGNEIAKNSKP